LCTVPKQSKHLPSSRNRYYHARLSGDVVGVEVCAAFKDLYAIGISSANGMLERIGRAPNGTLMYSSAGNSGNCLKFNRIEELAECAQHPVNARLLFLPSDLVAYVVPNLSRCPASRRGGSLPKKGL
jgi:hypothetical protein